MTDNPPAPKKRPEDRCAREDCGHERGSHISVLGRCARVWGTASTVTSNLNTCHCPAFIEPTRSSPSQPPVEVCRYCNGEGTQVVDSEGHREPCICDGGFAPPDPSEPTNDSLIESKYQPSEPAPRQVPAPDHSGALTSVGEINRDADTQDESRPGTSRSPSPEVTEQSPERVEQGDAEGCGAAVLAMLVGISYEEAKADLDRYHKDDHDWATQGTWYGAIDQALARRGYYVQRRFQSDYEGPFAPLHYASVKQPSGGGHFVVMTTEGKVLDPLREGDLTLADYEINNVVGVCRPASEVAEQPPNLDEKCERCDHSRGHHVPGCVKCRSLGLSSCLAFDEPTSSEVAVEAEGQDACPECGVAFGQLKALLADAEATALDALMRLAQQKVSTENAEAALARSEAQRKQVEEAASKALGRINAARHKDSINVRPDLAGKLIQQAANILASALSSDSGKEEK